MMWPSAKEPTLVVGTAGHIDHGKSRLVLAVTGVDPDRLPEEQARGMTIDLGFAHASIAGCQVSFVDVPGHERFIRNMLAGASGVDVALLVVAADDSVMPQTREHAEVLSLLGVSRCVVALTKMDLVDDEWADAVEEEVRELLATLHLEPIAFVRTSSVDGRGVAVLRDVLSGIARDGVAAPDAPTWFRLPIDRAFTVPGRGTVVTGSVAHGRVQKDDELECWPPGEIVRVRGLQTHNDQCDQAIGRMRLAVNLAGVSHEDVGRGQTLATPGYLEPARYLDARVAWLRMPGKQVRQTLRLRLHMATSEVLAELRLAEKPAASEVRDAFAQIKTATPIVVTWGQRFILRDESGMRTLGGGLILRPVARLWTARRPAHEAGLTVLHAGGPSDRLAEVIRAAEWRPLAEARLAARAGLKDADAATKACQRLMGGGRIRRFEAAGTRLYVHNEHLSSLADDLERRLKDYLEANPRQAGLPRSQWPGWMPGACPARLRPALADWFLNDETFMLRHDHVVPAGDVPQIPEQDHALLEQILKELHTGAFQPPGLKALKCYDARGEKRIRELIDLAVTRGVVVRLADGLWLHADRWDELARKVADAIRSRGQLTVAEIRTLLESSRKYVVPIVEKLDEAQITKRRGDQRILGAAAPKE